MMSDERQCTNALVRVVLAVWNILTAAAAAAVTTTTSAPAAAFSSDTVEDMMRSWIYVESPAASDAARRAAGGIAEELRVLRALRCGSAAHRDAFAAEAERLVAALPPAHLAVLRDAALDGGDRAKVVTDAT
jgi:hypothetical protein